MPSNADEMEATDDHEPDGESGFPQPADEPVRDGDEAGGHTPGGNAPPAHMQDHTKPHSLSPSGADGKRRVVRVMLTLGSLVILATGGHFLLLQRMEEQWREFSEEFRQAALPETRRAIDEQVEDAFAPVYAAIPSLLDWHYSPRGRITKPILIVFGKLEERIESRLLGGLEERIGVAVNSVGRVMQEEGLNKFERWYDREVTSLPLGVGRVYKRKLDRRFVASVGPTSVVAAFSIPVSATNLEDRVARSLSPGVEGRVLRTSRALMGRFVSRVMGGIVAGIPGWLVTGFAVGKLEERQGRRELQQELTQLVNAEKETVKSVLSAAIDDIKLDTLR